VGELTTVKPRLAAHRARSLSAGTHEASAVSRFAEWT
jgi:hypothetical protein